LFITVGRAFPDLSGHRSHSSKNPYFRLEFAGFFFTIKLRQNMTKKAGTDSSGQKKCTFITHFFQGFFMRLTDSSVM